MTDATELPRRGRPPKDSTEMEAEGQQPEMRRERRRKDTGGADAGLRLAIPDWVYDKYPKKDFRLAWIVADPTRMAQKHKEDWDPVEGVTPVPGAFSRQLNKPVDHVLHVKKLEWVMEDRAEAETRRRIIEEQATKGKVSGKGDDAGGGLSENVSYADASNRLR